MEYKTLFLDRDGVINRKKVNGYITSVEEFEFLPGVLEAISKLTRHFKNILIVTNQQCIGKGIITLKDLEKIHQYMLEQINRAGGKIDKIYFSPYLEKENSEYRKPDAGMAYQAQRDFPAINFTASVMVGDSFSDMQFGKKTGMKTVFLTNGIIPAESVKEYADEIYENLTEFAESI